MTKAHKRPVGENNAETENLSAPLYLADAAFKETEIGPIPVDWDVVPLGQVVELSNKEPR